MTGADRAVSHLLSQIRNDGRLAYLLGYGSQSFELLTQAYADRTGESVDEFRKQFWALCNPRRITVEEPA